MVVNFDNSLLMKLLQRFKCNIKILHKYKLLALLRPVALFIYSP